MKHIEYARILSQRSLGDDIFDMWIHTDRIAREARPGQFLTLYSQDPRRLLPRPISISEIEPKAGKIRLVYRVAGVGTKEFSALHTGDILRVMGPLGNGFPLEPEGRVMIVGGGIGVPPLLGLAKALPGEKVLVMGYRSRTYLEEDLRKTGELVLATEDGSRGTRGNVLDAIREKGIRADVMYACGPTPMLAALKRYAEETQMTAWFSMEERMACGIGACLACICSTSSADSHTKVNNARVCKEGPVFNAKEVAL